MTTYGKSINGALNALLASDPSIHLLGEDILDPYGGAFKISQGLSSAFPDQVIGTPISEAGFTGIATGMALRGLRPIVEIMFGDFMTLTFDQILNHMIKFRDMYGRDLPVPVVIRTPMGGGRGYGATHSQSLEKYFCGIPGLTVVAPSHLHDPGELLTRAVKDLNGPCLFVEHKMLYPLELYAPHGAVRVSALTDDPFPTLEARNFAGSGRADVGIITYGGTSRLLMPLLETLADEEITISAGLVASLDPLPTADLIRLATGCDRLLIVEEGTAGFTWGAEVIATLHEGLKPGTRLPPIQRLSSQARSIPASRDGEAATLISTDIIESTIMRMLA